MIGHACRVCGVDKRFYGCFCRSKKARIIQFYLSHSDFLALWKGRPKDKPVKWIECPVYVFSFKSMDYGLMGNFVHVKDVNYRPKNWRGLI